VVGTASRRLAGVVVIVWGLAAGLPSAGSAQTFHSFSFSLFGGVGGSPDVDDAEYGNTTIQAAFGVEMDRGTTVTVRAGRLAVEPDHGFGAFDSADLDYVTVTGDYSFNEPAFKSSLFLGLGAYRFDGERDGLSVEETVPGLTFGVGADFPLTKQISVVLELAAHWADLEEAQLFATGLGGLSIKF
jgi:hypothetical protein